ncbi:uncharacterized protein BP01DRAFT_316628 [Aspergillus saccharolyticus JOP 1030-1]|uniref:Mediator of RNA polymerase II transcription subunit 13 n=1 Tax=Aspergillus saccharolyticus JOP 1030-1 TaxID=1450539 RepID=A0A318ZJK3_9EURO|nr:hypothetical protein BP01DRAFT_316628 [Aspergillus saccharolyticus JOP 1030-1]PYH46564.1 hypothetical protein BP01DRAFT_316628 [Aspergillus saccharolyticus JOP 1030-1]
MDFPGGSVTNIRVIDGFSQIYWRIYTEEPGIIHIPGEAPANGYTILKHLSRLKDLELRLRNLDCLVSSYPRRLCLWVFSPTPGFESLASVAANQGKDDSGRLLVGATTLKVSSSGSVSSSDLVKNLSAEPQNAAGAARPQRPNAPTPFVTIYASFISALMGILSLQLIQQTAAIPLGSRTLLTLDERGLDGAAGFGDESLAFAPSLTTLQVQLIAAGKLTVALQTAPQPGLLRLCNPEDDLTQTLDIAPGTDLWLSPSGSIARLVTTQPAQKTGSSPYPYSAGGMGSERSDPVNRKQWMANVLGWLTNFGLPVSGIGEDSWVEVEVWEPFYSRLAGETWRPNDGGLSTLPLKRILWPAIYCFRRTKSAFSDSYGEMESVYAVIDDPLEFAEKWSVLEKPNLNEPSPKPPSVAQEAESKDQDAPTPITTDMPEGLESLSRASQYPDLQTASLVYPTPPDGATTAGLNPTTVSSDAFSEDIFSSSTFPQPTRQMSFSQPHSRNRSGTDVTMGFGPSAGLAVGSGLYDTNDDDDLFGDMNERDFGAKGITDADFSFFDDPGFDRMAEVGHANALPESPNFVETGQLEVQPTPVEHNYPNLMAEAIDGQIFEPDVEQMDVTTEAPAESPPHARDMSLPSPQEDNAGTISPPLSPVEVKKFLFPETKSESHPTPEKGHMPGYYNPIHFKQGISSWDQKYSTEGKFWFTMRDKDVSDDVIPTKSDIPTIGLLRRKTKSKNSAGGKQSDDIGSPPSVTLQKVSSDSDTSDAESIDSEEESGSESGLSPATDPSRKRKRSRSNSGSSSALSPEKTSINVEQDTTQRPEDSVFLGNFLSTFSDWSLTGYFTFPSSQTLPVLLQKDVQVQIAQILVDQVTQSSLNHKYDGSIGRPGCGNEAHSPHNVDDESFMGGIERLDLNTFVSLQDTTALSPATQARQPAQRRETSKGTISRLGPPHLRVCRGKDFLETLPPAIPFWETFGLGPAHGQKDILAYCIHPHTAAAAADSFLDRLGLVYSGCNFGNHDRGDGCNFFDRGLGSWDISWSHTRYSSTMQSLKTICEELGSALTKSPPGKENNLVVYIVNPFAHAAALVDICSAFWSLFQRYVADTDKQQARQLNELVLQIIPIDFLVSNDSLIVPPQAEYLNLALEVYSRCPPKLPHSSQVNGAPPMLLAEPLPKIINFKLSSEKTSPLQEGKCLHVACSRSQDQRWMSVAWSDNTGALQQTMSYCLRFRNSSAVRSIAEVRNEIWCATKDIMDRSQARWRVIVANTDPVDQEEVDTWTNFAEQYNKSRSTSLDLTILCVGTTAELTLEPPFLPMPMSAVNPLASATPIATPNPSISSPDQISTAPTPPSGANAPLNAPTPTETNPEIESESLLMDICDETWGVVLSHRLNSSMHQTEYRPALASGYLLRRRGSTDGDGVYTMAANIIYTRRPPGTYDSLLREILGMYRDLATLARARGTRAVQHGTLPWHLATVVKAQSLLSYVL